MGLRIHAQGDNDTDSGCRSGFIVLAWNKVETEEYCNTQNSKKDAYKFGGCIQSHILAYYIVGEKQYGYRMVCPNSQYSEIRSQKVHK